MTSSENQCRNDNCNRWALPGDVCNECWFGEPPSGDKK